MKRIAMLSMPLLFSMMNQGFCAGIELKIKSLPNTNSVSAELTLDGKMILTQLGGNYGSFGRTNETSNRCNFQVPYNTASQYGSVLAPTNRFYNIKNLICDGNNQLNFNDTNTLVSAVEKNIWGYFTEAQTKIKISTSESDTTTKLGQWPNYDDISLLFPIAKNSLDSQMNLNILNSFMSSSLPDSGFIDQNNPSIVQLGNAIGPKGEREVQINQGNLNSQIDPISSDLALNIQLKRNIAPKRTQSSSIDLNASEWHHFLNDSSVYAIVKLNNVAIDQWNNPSLKTNLPMVATLRGDLKCVRINTSDISQLGEIVFKCDILENDGKIKIENRAFKNKFKTYSPVPMDRGFNYQFQF